MPAKRDYVERFWEKVDRRGPDECWEWLGHITKQGYGQFWTGKRDVTAHRASWEIAGGDPPGDLWVLHKCDNRPCVNPSHLFIGTPMDNTQDMISKGRMIHNPRYGEDVGTSKLTRAQVDEILRRYTGRHGEQSALAREFGVSQAQIWRIIVRDSWRHVE